MQTVQQQGGRWGQMACSTHLQHLPAATAVQLEELGAAAMAAAFQSLTVYQQL